MMAAQPLKGIIVVIADTGMRNASELYCMRESTLERGCVPVGDRGRGKPRDYPPGDCTERRVSDLINLCLASILFAWSMTCCRFFRVSALALQLARQHSGHDPS